MQLVDRTWPPSEDAMGVDRVVADTTHHGALLVAAALQARSGVYPARTDSCLSSLISSFAEASILSCICCKYLQGGSGT